MYIYLCIILQEANFLASKISNKLFSSQLLTFIDLKLWIKCEIFDKSLFKYGYILFKHVSV